MGLHSGVPDHPRRALKTRGNTPKYGLIFHSTFIGRAAAKNKGRISRYLANKCTIASRIDCFSGGLLEGSGCSSRVWGGCRHGPERALSPPLCPGGIQSRSAVMGTFFVNSISPPCEW